MDSSKLSLKAVLHIISMAHFVDPKETYENLSLLFNKIQYAEHQWIICGDLKISGLLLGQQANFTKMSCFLCDLDSRAGELHWKKIEWPKRSTVIPGLKNILRPNLVDLANILLPPLHKKLSFMKQFTKALDRNGTCFKYV